MKLQNPCIKVTSRSFSKHLVLKQELLELFPNSFFITEDSSTNLPGIVEFLQDADGVILGLEQMDMSTLQQLKKLKIVAKFGVGLDNLDVEFAKQIGITVGWSGGLNKRSVSEQTVCFMLGLCRNIFFSAFPLKQGRWEKDGGTQLTGKNIGIIGCGYIGTDVIHLLQPFNCRIMIADLLDKKEVVDNYGVAQVSIKTLLNEADVVSLHVPLTELTLSMVNKNFLQQMKPSAFLINTSRGPVVNQKDLKNALQKNIITGAALDVFQLEPPEDQDFLSLPNLMVTPHIGGTANEAVLEMGRSAIRHLKDFFKTQWT